jgi:hypothetical protein
MPLITRQQLCVELATSESTIRRLELFGLPFTLVGIRAKRYDLDECRNWLREHQCQPGSTKTAAAMSASWPGASEFTESCRKVQLRVMPSS